VVGHCLRLRDHDHGEPPAARDCGLGWCTPAIVPERIHARAWDHATTPVSTLAIALACLGPLGPHPPGSLSRPYSDAPTGHGL